MACIYLEGIPREVAAMITAEVETPTIGIGAGPECDGQVLVFHDLVNLTFGHAAKFVRRYGDAAALITQSVLSFKADVVSHQFPNDSESYHLPKDTQAALETGTPPQARHAAIMASGENVVRCLVLPILVSLIVLAALVACSKAPDAAPATAAPKATGLESIPAPGSSKYPSFRDMSDWKNPYLVVREDGIGFVDLSNHEVHILKPEEIPR